MEHYNPIYGDEMPVIEHSSLTMHWKVHRKHGVKVRKTAEVVETKSTQTGNNRASNRGAK